MSISELDLSRRTGEIVVQRERTTREAAGLLSRHAALLVWLLALVAGAVAE